MTTQFWLGVAVIPAIAALVYGAVILKALIDTHWTRWPKPWWTTDDTNVDGRARHAADVALARRTLHIPTPFGVVLVYRTKDDPSASIAADRQELASHFTQTMRDLGVRRRVDARNRDELF